MPRGAVGMESEPLKLLVTVNNIVLWRKDEKLDPFFSSHCLPK
jgi:hypothetical protein